LSLLLPMISVSAGPAEAGQFLYKRQFTSAEDNMATINETQTLDGVNNFTFLGTTLVEAVVSSRASFSRQQTRTTISPWR
jgi:hypothetical protein